MRLSGPKHTTITIIIDIVLSLACNERYEPFHSEVPKGHFADVIKTVIECILINGVFKIHLSLINCTSSAL